MPKKFGLRSAHLRIPLVFVALSPVVLRCTTEAVKFIRKMALKNRGRAWHDVLENFEAAKDEWSAMNGTGNEGDF
jgi:hypothetical protein